MRKAGGAGVLLTSRAIGAQGTHDDMVRALEPSNDDTLWDADAPTEKDSPDLLINNRPRAVVILPRGEAFRNFVYTGALDELAREAEVIPLSVVPDEYYLRLLQDRYRRVLQLREIQERWVVRIQREILDLAHGRWLWSEAAQVRWHLRDTESNTPIKWLKRSAKKLACYPFANRIGLDLLSALERKSSRWGRTTDEYLHLFRELKPALVFNCSHVHSRVAVPAVQAAQWLGIPTATFVFSWDNLTSQGRIIPGYDYYLVWNKIIRDQLLGIYPAVRSEQVFVTGTPQFDFHFRPEYYWSREEFCARVGADPARPIVLYSTSMPVHTPGEPLIIERIASMLRQMTDLGPPQLLVRVYPKDPTNRFGELKQRCPDVLFPEVPWEPTWLTPKIEDLYVLTNTLRHAAIGINVASTVSLELCMLDKPAINIGYNPPMIDISPVDYGRYYKFEHYRPVVESGGVEVAYAEEELPHILLEAFRFPGRRSLQRRALVRQLFGNTLDGQSSMRVAGVLQSLLSRNGGGR